MSSTLIVATVIAAGNALSPQLSTTPMPNDQHCDKVLRRSAEGLAAVWNGSAAGSKIDSMKFEPDGWMTMRTSAGRVVAKMRCM